MDRGTLDEASVVKPLRDAHGAAPGVGAARTVRAPASRAGVPIEPTALRCCTSCVAAASSSYGLSNMSETVFVRTSRARHDFFGVFDGIVVSAKVKLLKPEPAIYEHLRDQFKLDFAESVFIDDLRRATWTARAASACLPSSSRAPSRCAEELALLL